ncbi:MAG: NfeD family protein [Proteobacteria bacterium]|nr:NfeD family protein [Pseudomonadota bacterium]
MDWLVAHYDIVTWVILGIIFIVAEAATVSVVSIWFVGGCALALVLAFIGVPFWLQLIVAIGASAGLLVGCRKMITANLNRKKALKDEDISNLAEGKIGIVTEAIEPGKNGQIDIGGNYWTARGYNDEDKFDVNARVIVIRLDGLCCIVESAENVQ